ncbi:hypothetical protein SAMN05421813_13147 [Daejeonella rubra]|uniref:Uncharacterized protein n=1 Tax=Daejeonella rubra TaxID=990371 RepID=A0A1G9XMZ9_9SPHI|nr:hypothetical protein SAMN05421813_13147 [Daejeonella rubra]
MVLPGAKGLNSAKGNGINEGNEHGVVFMP